MSIFLLLILGFLVMIVLNLNEANQKRHDTKVPRASGSWKRRIKRRRYWPSLIGR